MAPADASPATAGIPASGAEGAAGSVVERAGPEPSRQALVKIRTLGGDATLYLNGVRAENPYEAMRAIGDSLDIRVVRPGYEEIVKQITVREHGNEYFYTPQKTR
jgi:hypothetical protein